MNRVSQDRKARTDGRPPVRPAGVAAISAPEHHEDGTRNRHRRSFPNRPLRESVHGHPNSVEYPIQSVVRISPPPRGTRRHSTPVPTGEATRGLHGRTSRGPHASASRRRQPESTARRGAIRAVAGGNTRQDLADKICCGLGRPAPATPGTEVTAAALEWEPRSQTQGSRPSWPRPPPGSIYWLGGGTI